MNDPEELSEAADLTLGAGEIGAERQKPKEEAQPEDLRPQPGAHRLAEPHAGQGNDDRQQ